MKLLYTDYAQKLYLSGTSVVNTGLFEYNYPNHHFTIKDFEPYNGTHPYQGSMSLDFFVGGYSTYSGTLPIYTITDHNSGLLPNRDISVIGSRSGDQHTYAQRYSGETTDINSVGWRMPLMVYGVDGSTSIPVMWHEDKGVWSYLPDKYRIGSEYYYYEVPHTITSFDAGVGSEIYNEGCAIFPVVSDIYYINGNSGQALYYNEYCQWVSDNITRVYYSGFLAIPQTGYYNLTMTITSNLVNGQEYGRMKLIVNYIPFNESCSGITLTYFSLYPVLPLRRNQLFQSSMTECTGLNTQGASSLIEQIYISPLSHQLHAGLLNRNGY